MFLSNDDFIKLLENSKNYYNNFGSEYLTQQYINSICYNDQYLWEDYKLLENNKSYTPNHIYQSYCRVLILVNTYNDINSKYYLDKNLLSTIKYCLSILQKYYNKNTKMIGNWWEWRIGIPFQYVCILIQLQNELKEYYTDFNDTIEKFVRGFVKHGDLTYANQASICRNLFLSGIILNNITYIDESIKYSINAFIQKLITQINFARCLQNFYIKFPKLPNTVSMFAGKEGIYEDGSFIQHTSIPYIGTYGIEIIQYAALLLVVTNNTNVQIPKEIIDMLPIWINKAYLPAIYNGEMMLMYMGRAINNSTKDSAELIQKYIEEISNILNININNQKEFSIVQANADKLIHQNSHWRFAVSMSSDRIAKYESFIRATGNQNTKGWYQNEGMTYLYTMHDPTQYNQYFDKVNPYKLPGTTVALKQLEEKESVQPLFNYKNINELKSGGVEFSNKFSSCMMQVNNETGLTAKKSWFMCNNLIVCLGTDINYKGNEEVITTIENRIGNYNIFVNNKIDNQPINTDHISIKDIGDYYFPERVNIHSNQTDSSKEIWLSHGLNPNNASYCYIFEPLVFNKLSAKDKINILYNNEKAQIIKYNIDNIYFLNIWKSGNYKLDDIIITIKNQASLIIQKENNILYISISDYTQDQSKIELKINNYTLDTTYNNIKEKDYIIINTNNKLGKTIKFNLIKKWKK